MGKEPRSPRHSVGLLDSGSTEAGLCTSHASSLRMHLHVHTGPLTSLLGPPSCVFAGAASGPSCQLLQAVLATSSLQTVESGLAYLSVLFLHVQDQAGGVCCLQFT